MNYLSRIDRVREWAVKNNADAVLVSSAHNKFYLGGLYSGSGYVLVTKNSQYVIVDFRYYEEVVSKDNGLEVVLLSKENTIDKIINSVKVKEGIEKIGFEAQEVTYDFYSKLKDSLNCELVPMDLSKIRMIKDCDEIENIKKACEIADSAFNHILGFIKEGISEKAVENELVRFIKDNGGQKESFDTIVASGVRGALPHGKASEKLISRGELVTLDFGVRYNNYCSDITRTLALGQCSSELKHIYNIVKAAGEEAMKIAKPGVTLGDLDFAARSFIEKEGYGEYFGHNLGHGLGIQVHEYPSVAPNNKEVLKEGMVITIEPGIYFPHKGGVRIEEDILITDKGCIKLTNSIRDLIVI
jgi:Xaa-Pro aminopeptidase/Xaa-Pro dipeptidase